jgi:hypothetical protein
MTPGQLVYEAFADQFPGETWGPWENVSALPMGERHGWEKVAQAVLNDAFPGLREQVRLAREDRDQLRKQVLDLAAALEAEGAEEIAIARKRQGPADEIDKNRGRVFKLCASRIRKIAGPPS